MIADLGLTASLRAVLEHLDERGPQTVPQIAEEKSVRRQSIQALVDQLREAGLVTTKPNPAHRRSVLVSLTREGETVFTKVRKRERAKLRELLHDLEDEDLATAVQVLGTFRNALLELNPRGQSNDT
jgi:DNA-binding MarR family transcriptional regulator